MANLTKKDIALDIYDRLQITIAVLIITIFITGCPATRNMGMDAAKKITAPDEKYANVFKLLDGEWEGSFYIYIDPKGQLEGDAEPKLGSSFDLENTGLKLIEVIKVKQSYHSISPYYQKVKITDLLTTDEGEKEIVESYGVNKIEGGKMWCIVQKPNELVIHEGETDDPNTIIWRRKVKFPLKVEYFRETVSDNRYTILGWGYYGGDNLNLAPRTWFKGDYKRVEKND